MDCTAFPDSSVNSGLASGHAEMQPTHETAQLTEGDEILLYSGIQTFAAPTLGDSDRSEKLPGDFPSQQQWR